MQLLLFSSPLNYGADNVFRVLLKASAVKGSDYINASFIDVSLSIQLHFVSPPVQLLDY